jgi:SH3 domain protein
MAWMRAGSFRGCTALAFCLAALAPFAVSAETAWVKGEVRLNIRTGGSNEYRIIGEVKTGDRVEILEKGEYWTRIRTGDKEGWIPDGYLQGEPPAQVLLGNAQSKTSELSEQVKTLGSERDKLAEENRVFTERDTSQKSEIDTLTRENMELKAGARWPEWITGAVILSVGMLMGWIVHIFAGRRSRPRIRL